MNTLLNAMEICIVEKLELKDGKKLKAINQKEELNVRNADL
jgi:hypothetical protein